MKILIVEDSRMMGKACEALLVSAGHQVSWIVGARSLQPFIGIAPSKADSSVNPNDFDLAFCDGQLEGKFEGHSITEVLTAAGVTVVGMSTVGDMNDAMKGKGACAGFNKALWFLGLVSGDLDPNAVKTHPETIQPLLSKLELVAKDPAVRGKADALLMSHVSAD